MLNDEYLIDLADIKYCLVTVFFKETDNIFTQVCKYLGICREKQIMSSDFVMMEKDSEMFIIDKCYDNTIEFDYYDYGSNSDIIPKSIIKEENKTFYLCLIQDRINNKYTNKYIGELYGRYFQKNPQKNLQKNIDMNSIYTCTYKDYEYDTIAFGIAKLEQSSDILSKFIIGYDTTILDLDEVKSIIKKILIK